MLIETKVPLENMYKGEWNYICRATTPEIQKISCKCFFLQLGCPNQYWCSFCNLRLHFFSFKLELYFFSGIELKSLRPLFEMKLWLDSSYLNFDPQVKVTNGPPSVYFSKLPGSRCQCEFDTSLSSVISNKISSEGNSKTFQKMSSVIEYILMTRPEWTGNASPQFTPTQLNIKLQQKRKRVKYIMAKAFSFCNPVPPFRSNRDQLWWGFNSTPQKQKGWQRRHRKPLTWKKGKWRTDQ